MSHLFIGILLSLLAAFGNVYRGANKFAKHGFSGGIMRMLVALVPTIAILLPFKPDWYVWAICYPLILYFSLTAGWGTWFHIRSQEGWKHNLDAFWVEIMMTIFMGKHWIPEGEELKSKRLYPDKDKIISYLINKYFGKLTVIKTFNSSPRPLPWYIIYNFLAMSFRGLGFGFCVVSILMCLYGFHSLYILILGLSFTMGICYNIWYDLQDEGMLDKLPKLLNHTPNALGEFLYGAVILGAPLYWICVLISLT